jgi:large subunit ribosomal protein L13
VINAEKIVVTGNKMADKMYYTHSGKRGKLKTISLQDHLAKDAPGVIKKAVQGMLPHNKLRKSLLNKLKVYSGAEHRHQAQQLKELKVS